jgi:ubiquinone/menaquinone biosynthesis C-methylase UbiE
MINKMKRVIAKLLGIHYLPRYQSETAKVRHKVIDWCEGFGCDIGFGGDKIKKENCLGIDYTRPYANTGDDKVDIACDLLKQKIPVADDYFDYVYSSHLIEDFEDTASILQEFVRIVKQEGKLILVFPDQARYEHFCKETNQLINSHHVHKDMGLNFMKNKFQQLENVRISFLYESDCEIEYNVIVVVKVDKV